MLTEQMNDKVNPRQNPYMVMEALCDFNEESSQSAVSISKDSPRTVIYAGGLYEEYGLANLVEAFVRANISDAKLVIYGDGPYVAKLKQISEEFSNVEYKGIKPNSVVVEDELRASLLVNPRPTTEEFTKYSFPSKNMEYMVSGTPLLTTRLPGMPKEYYPYVFMIEDETIDGYAEALADALSKTEDELVNFGQKAKKFVLENKNYIIQTRRIIELIQS
jgi:glycosyltransferase involved in cell wall biosynthesis